MNELIVRFAYFILFLAGLLFYHQQAINAETLSQQPRHSEQTMPAYVVEQYMKKIATLEAEVNELNGRLQMFEFRMRQMQDYLSSYIAQNEERLEKLAAKPDLKNILTKQNNFEEQIITEDQILKQTSYPNQKQTVKQQYEFARSFLLSSDYEQAERALIKFIEMNAGHELSGNAHYWLGETYFIREDHINAIDAFSASYKQYPNGVKAPDSLYKLALSFHAQNHNKEACIVLNQIVSDYPNARQTLLKHVEKTSLEYQCRP